MDKAQVYREWIEATDEALVALAGDGQQEQVKLSEVTR